MHNIAIFASGSGTNAENIIKFFQNDPIIKVKLVLCNNPKAYVIQRAKNLKIESKIFTKEELYNEKSFIRILNRNAISFIVLAGFLWLLPEFLIRAFPKKIINIHPALLPKFGGKGMYGLKVHEAVLKANERESGITIHYINEYYDEGSIIIQYKCRVFPESDTPEILAERIHKLEYQYYPAIINDILTNKIE
jgi:phosphoribosylglycinamide formyltransferase 1